MAEPVTWQRIGIKMLDWEAQKRSRQLAIAQLEQLAQRSEPIPPEELLAVVAILKRDAA